jgi:hypothetical protein
LLCSESAKHNAIIINGFEVRSDICSALQALIKERKHIMLKKTFILGLLMAVLILPVGAKACLVSVTITATDGNNTAIQTFCSRSVTIANGDFECVFVNKYGPEISLFDGGAITSLKLTMDSDPEVGIEFGVRASNSATIYSILSDVVSFDPLVNPTAEASAGITLTDRGGGGATITGRFPGGKTYQARYNDSTVFVDLVSGFSIPKGTKTTSEDSGSVGLIGTLTSIESEFYFTLSARDAASGTSTFSVVPEPATICLLGLGALSLLRSRKRKT